MRNNHKRLGPPTLRSEPSRPVKDEPVRKHFHLVAVEIIYNITSTGSPAQDEEIKHDPTTVQSIRQNVLCVTDDGRIAVKQIADYQKAVLNSFAQKIHPMTFSVLDIVTFGISHLGKFTSEEFNAGVPKEQPQQTQEQADG